VLVQLAAYLNSAPDGGGWAQSLAASTLGFPVWAHAKLDGRTADPSPTKDNLGFSSAYHHRFTLDLQNAWLDDAVERQQQLRSVRLTTGLSSLPGFLEPHSFALPFAQGNFSEAALDLGFDGRGLVAVDVEFDAMLAGYYAQWVNPGITGTLVGLGTGLEFVDRNTLGYREQYALAHFVGPSLAFFWSAHDFVLTVASRLYGDFAPIRSLAWPKVQAADPDATYKSTLGRGYQYNLGFSSRSYAAFRFHSVSIDAQYELGRYQSIQGLDRFQEQITRDLSGTEELDQRRLTLALEPPGTGLRFTAGLERFRHQSRLANETAARLERRLVAGAGLVF
jgi:hypothetical protein